jgi:hypothetical protein
LLAVIYIFIWVWLRCTFPRYRYDIIIKIFWRAILPLSLAVIVLNTGYKFVSPPKLNKLEPFKGSNTNLFLKYPLYCDLCCIFILFLLYL